MHHAPSILTACRLIVAVSLVVCSGAQASTVASGKARDGGRASGPAVSVAVSEPPSLALLALGLIGIGLHGLNRFRDQR